MGGQGAKFLVMTLCQVLFGTYFHTRKVKHWGGGHGPRGPPGSATVLTLTEHSIVRQYHDLCWHASVMCEIVPRNMCRLLVATILRIMNMQYKVFNAYY